jgi:hypothetical protein
MQQEINFFKDNSGKIIGRADNGKICIISFNFKGGWVKECETWLCDIVDDQERKMIVMPVRRIQSADENHSQVIYRVNRLKEVGFQKPFTHPRGTRVYYKSK